MTYPRTLIILPCHSIWKQGGQTLGVDQNEWHLADFQLEGQDHLVFRAQILDSLKLLQQDEDSYLIISGGATKKEAGPVSEALSYFQLAQHFICDDTTLLDRINLEEFARDSFENVIFSLCRFYEIFGAYPENITVVGFEFKRGRFVLHHLEQALCFPKEKVTYIGSSPITDHLTEEARERYYQELESNEFKHALRYFQQDWYGINGSLKEKKKIRNPYNKYHGYANSNPNLADFLMAINDNSAAQPSENIRALIDKVPWINN
ncbi:uncharacterized protein J8A68_005688 [[Candida] subhashii]|uniref:DUF218 domain-containing protein n=1 Tax=[Candida] subhashii TaxID=561895 RepID=A0A8J5Q5F4_9ASCO|nr:uncharacterized protein J8A68_005688 [[Candida] subhashii]KAG7660726.1 hypothetical protein J8A68_005688 [[Candida] subhashii]